MKYRSLSLTGFEAVQVDLSNLDPIKSHRWQREKPQWFQEMLEGGKISVVRNSKDQYLLLKNDNATFRVYERDYIVRNRKGLTFWMPEVLFAESFVPDNDYYSVTPKQQVVLDYIISCDRCPTIREIMNGLGYASPSVVKRHIDSLAARGRVEVLPGRARGIRVL